MSENIGIGIDQYFSKLTIDIGIANTIVQLLVLILVNSSILCGTEMGKFGTKMGKFEAKGGKFGTEMGKFGAEMGTYCDLQSASN